MRNYIKVTSYRKMHVDRAEGEELLLLFFDSEDALGTDTAYKRALEASGKDAKASISCFLPMPGYLGERDFIGTMLYNCGHYVFGDRCQQCGNVGKLVTA